MLDSEASGISGPERVYVKPVNVFQHNKLTDDACPRRGRQNHSQNLRKHNPIGVRLRQATIPMDEVWSNNNVTFPPKMSNDSPQGKRSQSRNANFLLQGRSPVQKNRSD
jgi:hypothetical protein